MDAESVKAAYAANLKEVAYLRRYTGTGTSRPRFDVKTRAKAERYAATELIGGIQQGDQKLIVLVDDLIDGGYVLPITTTANDKAIVAGKELAIIAIQGERKVGSVLIAYDLQVRG